MGFAGKPPYYCMSKKTGGNGGQQKFRCVPKMGFAGKPLYYCMSKKAGAHTLYVKKDGGPQKYRCVPKMGFAGKPPYYCMSKKAGPTGAHKLGLPIRAPQPYSLVLEAI